MSLLPFAEPYFNTSFPPPALTSGLALFLVAFYCLGVGFPSIPESLVLKSSALTSLELNRLSFYPLVHLGIFHLLLNLLALLPLVRKFEKVNGTVRTGIVLNILSVVPGLVYCLLGLVLFPNIAVAGASGWVFSFLGYDAMNEWKRSPTFQLGRSPYTVPTWAVPVAPLLLTAILLPGSSFLGHLLGLGAGYAMALGFLDPLIEPSTKVVEWIETKVTRAIALIPFNIQFLHEVPARETRALARQQPLPTQEPASTSTSTFQGQGHTLGA